MAMRHFTVAVIAAVSVAASTIASSAGTVTPKQALAQGIPATARAKPAQPVRHLIVKLRDSATGAPVANRASLREFQDTAGVEMTHVRDLAGGASLVALRAAVPLDEARNIAAALARQPGVEYAEPDVMFKRLAVPNDPRYAGWQWNLFEPTATFTGTLLGGSGSKSAVAAGGANLPPAWDITQGGSGGVVVAVIDTGIVNHPDLNGVATPAPYVPAGRFVGGYDFVSSDVGSPVLAPNFVANDGDGRDPDPTDPGDWLAVADSCEDGTSGPLDSSWHGTHMAGVVAATGNNGAGIAGIGWNVRVQPLRALGKCGGSLSDIAEAIRWAAGLDVPGVPANPTPARVISLSLGSSEACSNATQAAVDAAIGAGTVVVAATGNEGADALISPANCRGVIAVTGHTINGENADYANIGAATTISAPGGGSPIGLGAGGPTDDRNWTGYYVWSTLLFGATDPTSSDAQGRSGAGYGGFTGTSVAAPHVAGAAALIKSLLPSASLEQVRGFLVNNARPFPAGSACATGGSFAGQCGAGLLDAGAAVGRAVLSAPPVIVSGPQSLSIVEGQTATLAVTAAGAATLNYQWKRNGTDIPGATSSSYTTPALSVGDSGTRYSVSVTNALGSVTSAEATITVTAASTGGPASPPVGGGGGGGALPLGQLLLLVALLAGARLRRRE
jgi:serine protease